MTIVLVCPQCRNQNAYEERNLDTSKEITCSACGYSELPTSFELSKGNEKKSWLVVKIMIIILVGIVFAFSWPFIALAAFYVPIIIAPVIVILLYRRWKEKQA